MLTDPLSGVRDPPRMPSSVLLPAPFSPARVRTSPWRSVKLTSSRARTPGNDLATLLISRRGDVMARCPLLLARVRSRHAGEVVRHVGLVDDEGRHVYPRGHLLAVEQPQRGLHA